MEGSKVMEMSKEDLPLIHFGSAGFPSLLMCLAPYFRIVFLLGQMRRVGSKWKKPRQSHCCDFSGKSSPPSCHSIQRNVIYIVFILLILARPNG